MNPDIEYPYMPEGRHLKYVPVDHEFMQAASKARDELAGDPLWPVGIVAVKDGVVVARAGNGFNRGPQKKHICPRIVQECPSGVGYDLCDLHSASGHSEVQLVKAMQEAGIETEGADAYMYGHWWACEPCWSALIDAGFRDLYVVEDAHERFAKANVYAETLSPSYCKALLEGFTQEELEKAKVYCDEIGCEIVTHPDEETVRVVRTSGGMDCFTPGASAPVYEIRSEEPGREFRMLKQVLRSL